MRGILSICLMALLMAGVVSAQVIKDGGRPDKDKGKDKDKDKEVLKGEVKKADGEKGILVVKINGKDEEFRVPRGTRITIDVANKVQDAKDGLNDQWFKSAEKAYGSGRFTVELTKDKTEIVKVHLLTPTSRKEP
jgi:hypothetical protein